MLTLAIVTKEVEAERHIWHLARYDALTQLANRSTFHEALRRHLEARLPAALLFIDLDGFKLVNDTRGHRAGDRLLVQVADRLRSICEAPGASLARLGGDEFAVLIPHSEDADARALAVRVIGLLSEPYDLDPGQVRIGASVGIALAPEQGETGELLLARADIALYAAKSAGKGVALVFAPEMEARIQERVLLEGQLREALQDRQGLSVFYQPIVSIKTGQVTAREALVRWYHPVRGWIPPSEFVPVAEQSGLIDALGEFVLTTACRDAALWEDGARVAVNVSAAQLGRDLVAQHILSALVNSRLAPDRLEVEVTETALLDEGRDVIGDLRRIRALGVRVALDDFGTGFSSLAHLRLFPFDKIKIDGSFVKEATSRPDCAAIVRAVADLGRRLGVTTVAEGVETRAQYACVREEGCTEVQGYLIGRPAPNGEEDELEMVDSCQA
ncbi:putative bifunctional diguanylate cyclase/phosphodiesterase [Sphingomonas quercus]|nr:EAL domain-containing protein [Sphingomonas quercus]